MEGIYLYLEQIYRCHGFIMTHICAVIAPHHIIVIISFIESVL